MSPRALIRCTTCGVYSERPAQRPRWHRSPFWTAMGAYLIGICVGLIIGSGTTWLWLGGGQ